jgi:hypothetical protein
MIFFIAINLLKLYNKLLFIQSNNVFAFLFLLFIKNEYKPFSFKLL